MMNDNSKYDFGTPDLAHWWSLDLVPIWDATVLSFGDCPLAVAKFTDKGAWVDDPIVSKRWEIYRLRANMIMKEIRKESEFLKSSLFLKNNSNGESVDVSLLELRSWAASRNLKLDEKFRTYGNNDSDNRIGGVMLELPYENKFMSALADAMWKHFGRPEENKNPLQKNVSSDLATKEGVPKRAVVSLAAAIHPYPDRQDKTHQKNGPSKAKKK